MTNFPHTEHRLAPREFPLITHDPANPASGRARVNLKKHVYPTWPEIRAFNAGRKSVDRWAPAFAGLISGCFLTALIILVGSSVLS